jgi:site-specific recombinase XerC
VARYWFYLRHLLLRGGGEVPFSKAPDIRSTFPSHLSSVCPDGGTETLAPATLKKIVSTAKRFFLWVKATCPGEFRGLPKRWIDTSRPPRSVQSSPNHEFVTLDEGLQLAALEIEEGNLALQRGQIGAAFLYVSGMRASALGSLPLEAVDVASRTMKRWPSLGVRMKNGNTATTHLLEIPELSTVT